MFALPKYVIITFLFTSCSTSLFSQILDTSSAHNYKPADVAVYNTDQLLFFTNEVSPFDTSLNLFYNYYPSYQNAFPFVDLGLEATPILTLSEKSTPSLSLRLGADQLTPYLYDDSIRIYQTTNPFTRLNYSQGANEMLSIEVTHAQQISERLSFGVDYRRIKNQNFYFSNLHNFSRVRMGNLFNTKFYTSYYTPNRKYEMVSSYIWNKSKNTVSGGLISDSTFNTQFGREKLNNSLVNYTNAIGTLAQNKFNVTQYFRPGGASNDTVLDTRLSQFDDQFYLSTSLKNERIEFEDNDPDSLIYGTVLLAFKDSAYHRSIENELGYTRKLGKGTLFASVIHDYSNIFQNDSIQSYQNLFFKIRGKIDLNQSAVSYRYKMGLMGFNQGDYLLEGMYQLPNKKKQIQLTILSQQTEPTLFQQTFLSNAVQWYNAFSKIGITRISGSISTSIDRQNIKFEMLGEAIQGIVYYHSNDQISQHEPTVNYFKTAIRHQLRYPHLGSDIGFLFQYSSNEKVLPRPRTSASGNLFSEFRLFQKKLRVQLGMRTYWFATFNSPRYNPYTRSWHITNTSFQMNPPLQIYANAQVKSFCMGIEFFHAQQGFMGEDYYSSPSYPMMPRSLRLNIRWDLNN